MSLAGLRTARPGLAVLALVCATAAAAGPPRLAGAKASAGEQATTIRELRFIFVSMAAMPVNDPAALGGAVRAIKAELGRRAVAADAILVTIGLALDEDPDVGLDFLLRGRTRESGVVPLGTWNELHVGRSWQNAYAVELIWRQRDAIAGVPQVLIEERSVTRLSDRIVVSDDRRLARVLGEREIIAWAQGSMPLPESQFLKSP